MRHVLVLCLVLCATAAQAGITLSYESTTKGKTRTVTMRLDSSAAAFDMEEAGTGRKATLLRDAKGARTMMVNHEQKSYVTISDADMQMMRARLEQQKQAMRGQLDKMPPDARKRMEQMLGDDKPDSTDAPRYTFEKKGSSRKMAGFPCDDYVIKEGGKIDGEGCFIPWKKAGMSADDIGVHLKEIAKGISGGRGADASLESDFHSSFPGLPAWRKRVDPTGATVSESTLKLLKKGPIDAKALTLPAGYTEQQRPMPGSGHGMPGGMKGPMSGPPPGMMAPPPPPAPTK